jgi:LemA protein
MSELIAGLGILGIFLVGLVIVLIIALLWLVILYNKFVVLRNRIDNAWAQIDVQLKRRYDLIPNLVETVKGYAKHEKETLAEVTKYRSALLTGNIDERMAANNMLTQALGKLFAVAESYPKLMANENFLKLQDELAGTENKIAYIRTAYNDTVLEYNNAIQVFPGSIVAKIFNFTPRPYLEVPETERAAVKVKF